MAFFSLWWWDQNDDMKDIVRVYVDEGRLEFINGGWSMNDEASPIYLDIIENMWAGH